MFKVWKIETYLCRQVSFFMWTFVFGSFIFCWYWLLKSVCLYNIFDYRNSAGFVFLRFENTQGAVAAQRALHGRWFAGKMITATFMVIIFFMTSFYFVYFNAYSLIETLIINSTHECRCPRHMRPSSLRADRILDYGCAVGRWHLRVIEFFSF